MKIIAISPSRFHNPEYLQFYLALLAKAGFFGEHNLVFTVYVAYLKSQVDRADELMLLLQKSIYTKEMEIADVARGDVFRGLCDVVKGLCRQLNETKRRAAIHLFNMLKAYRKDILHGNYIKESGSLHNLLQDLRGAYAADVALLGIGTLVADLEEAERKFLELQAARINESLDKSKEALKQVRHLLDFAYKVCMGMVDLQLEIDGLGGDVAVPPESLDTGSHEDGDPTPPHLFGNINYNFAYQWNEEVKKFRNLIAQREGRRKAKDGEEENGEENGEEDNDNIFEGEE
jgi:hypothetical protein